jgi:hypothetical protein
MFDFLFEGSLVVYLLLLALAVILLYFWQQQRDRRYLIGVIALGGLALLLLLLDRVRETDREGAIRTLREVTDLINSKQHEKAFEYLADDFNAYGMDRAAMKQRWETTLKRFDVSNIQIKSLGVEKQDRGKHTVTLRFNATGDSPHYDWGMAPCEVDFIRDGQGRWRIKSFRIYNPVQSAEEFNPFR